MAEELSATLATAAGAVTGADTPSNVRASRPTKESVWTLYGGMALSGFLAMILIGVLAGWWVLTPWPEVNANLRIIFLGAALILAVICQPITVIALASSRLGRVEASAGENHLMVAGRD